MTNTTILAFAFLDAAYRQNGCAFRLWHEILESDRQEHAITGHLFDQNPDITPKETHEAWVARRQADGWVLGGSFDPEAQVHPHMLPFDELPVAVQAAEFAGVTAMREALPYARVNRLPPDLEFDVMKRVAVANANTYLDIGASLGLSQEEQPSDMLLWGSLANARHHLLGLKVHGLVTDRHAEAVTAGISALVAAIGADSADRQPTHPGPQLEVLQ